MNLMGFNSTAPGSGNNNGYGSGNHTAISGGRKPTADSHAYPLYKAATKQNRNKFSNGGGSIGGSNDSGYETGYGAIQNNSMILMEK
jgi:hypothetical protein